MNRNKLVRHGHGLLRFRLHDCRESRWRRIDSRWNSWHLAGCDIPDGSVPASDALRSNSGRISAEGIPAVEIASEIRQAADAIYSF